MNGNLVNKRQVDRKKRSEKPHERPHLLAIKRLIATQMNASPVSGNLA